MDTNRVTYRVAKVNDVPRPEQGELESDPEYRQRIALALLQKLEGDLAVQALHNAWSDPCSEGLCNYNDVRGAVNDAEPELYSVDDIEDEDEDGEDDGPVDIYGNPLFGTD